MIMDQKLKILQIPLMDGALNYSPFILFKSGLELGHPFFPEPKLFSD